jgi:uncharacterized protein YxeA
MIKKIAEHYGVSKQVSAVIFVLLIVLAVSGLSFFASNNSQWDKFGSYAKHIQNEVNNNNYATAPSDSLKITSGSCLSSADNPCVSFSVTSLQHCDVYVDLKLYDSNGVRVQDMEKYIKDMKQYESARFEVFPKLYGATTVNATATCR